MTAVVMLVVVVIVVVVVVPVRDIYIYIYMLSTLHFSDTTSKFSTIAMTA
jgi:hypothetical protein